jgi:hypothetical protein
MIISADSQRLKLYKVCIPECPESLGCEKTGRNDMSHIYGRKMRLEICHLHSQSGRKDGGRTITLAHSADFSRGLKGIYTHCRFALTAGVTTGVSRMYAIRNKHTRKWLYGTDRSYADGKPRQRTSDDRAMLCETYEDAQLEYRLRRCGKDYEIVPVRLEALE